MATETQTYATPAERDAILVEMVAKGYRLLSESNIFAKRGDTVMTNTLAFTDDSEEQLTPVPSQEEINTATRLARLEAALAELQTRERAKDPTYQPSVDLVEVVAAEHSGLQGTVTPK